MRVATLASGSSGNATYVETDSTRILFDCGMSAKYIDNAMQKIGRSADQIQAIVVSHEHRDHIAGVGVLSRKYNIPVHFNKKTYEEAAPMVGRLHEHKITETDLEIGDIHIQPIKTSHDAIKPRAFIISNENKKFGIITDLGEYDDTTAKHMKHLDGAVIESNHDPYMLQTGPYPANLKKRVSSEHGHLSNFQAANLVTEHASDKLRTVFLGHLSRTNNTPEFAYTTFKSTIRHRQDLNPHVEVADPYSPSSLREVE